jgi:hypothetical protein
MSRLPDLFPDLCQEGVELEELEDPSAKSGLEFFSVLFLELEWIDGGEFKEHVYTLPVPFQP